MSQEILAVILGGGAGTRLYPLTASRSKPAVPIAGKYRLVDIPISNCINCGISRMFVLTQFNSASLNRHIKNTYHFSAFSSAFVDILAAEQTPDNPTWYQGTADAVRQCLRHIGPFESEYILILSGDQLYQMDFIAMLEGHKKMNADISIATIPVAARDASDFGIMKKNDEGYWTDIGNIYSFFEANLNLTSDLPEFNLFDNSKAIYTRARMLPPAKISGTTLEKTLIAEGCIINASRIENSVMGIRSRIEHGTTVVSSYVMGNDYFETLEDIANANKSGIPLLGIGHRCYIRN